MARLLFEKQGIRTRTGPLANGTVFVVYTDEAATVLADISTTVGGSAIAGSTVTVADIAGLGPAALRFYGPTDATEVLWMRTPSDGTLGVQKIESSTEDRLDALELAGGGAHPDLAAHDTLGLVTDSILATHAADTSSVHGFADTNRVEIFVAEGPLNAKDPSVGAVSDGSTDTTAALQSWINQVIAAGSNGEGYLPGQTDGGYYKITSALEIPASYNRAFRGAHGGTSGGLVSSIIQHTAGQPVLKFTEDDTHSIVIEDIGFGYPSSQTNSGSVGIQFAITGGIGGGFYYLHFNRVRVINAYDAIGIGGSGQVSVWGSQFDNLVLQHTKHTAVNLDSPTVIGMPYVRFSNLTIVNTGGAVTPTGPAVFAEGVELEIDGFDVEGWQDTVGEFSGGSQVLIKQFHLENHIIATDLNRLFKNADGTLVIDGGTVTATQTAAVDDFSAFAGMTVDTPGSRIILRDLLLNVIPDAGATRKFWLVYGDGGSYWYENVSSLQSATDNRIPGSDTATNTRAAGFDPASGSFSRVVVGAAALATTATDGFLYLPSCPGPPTGTPVAKTGTIPMVWDSSNHELYVYSGGAWKGGTAPGTFS